MLESLPAPTTAFGLDFFSNQITDAGLKEVAKLENLIHLYLRETQIDLIGCEQITDAGVGEYCGRHCPSVKLSVEPWGDDSRARFPVYRCALGKKSKNREPRTTRPKAPSPLRSAGALHRG